VEEAAGATPEAIVVGVVPAAAAAAAAATAAATAAAAVAAVVAPAVAAAVAPASAAVATDRPPVDVPTAPLLPPAAVGAPRRAALVVLLPQRPKVVGVDDGLAPPRR